VLALARAFGVEAYHAPDPDGLRAALDKALAQPGPALIEVPLAVEPPWEL
jgi:thiamine pyrophosphate-dependent acetolactate synthase large subunit-like protein